MDEQPERIREDLRNALAGQVRVDELTRAAFATDAGLLQVRPAAVVSPRTAAEVVEVLRYAAEKGLPVHPRGGGTGVAGESLGNGLMLDLARHLQAVTATTADTVTAQAGVRWRVLQTHLAARGRMLGPDPVSEEQATVGGMVATDGSGPHAMRHGTTADCVRSLSVVLADGETVELTDRVPVTAPGVVGRLARGVAEVVRRYADAIAAEQPAGLAGPGGYLLRDIGSGRTIDLARLLAGAEGSLGVVTSATLTTVPLPPPCGMVLACFSSLRAGAEAVRAVTDDGVCAAEILDRRLMMLVRAAAGAAGSWIAPAGEALVMVERDDAADLASLADRLGRARGRVASVITVTEPAALARWWRLRGEAVRRTHPPKLANRPGGDNVGREPVWLTDSVAVPPARVGEFLTRMLEIAGRHRVGTTVLGHLGTGCVHVRPLLDLADPAQRTVMRPLGEEIAAAARELGGTFHGEHGTGLLRTPLLPLQFPRLMPAFREIKRLFDPEGRLNPGRIADPDATRTTSVRSGGSATFPLHLLRPQARAGDTPTPDLQLLWPGPAPGAVATACNGCGQCASHHPSARMCPSFFADDDELAAPRSKANLLRQVASGQVEAHSLSSDEFREVADRCVQCMSCRIDCPAGVDVSKLMAEAKAANVAEHGLRRTDWFLSRLETFSRWASANALFANALLGNRGFRWLVEQAVGVSKRRRLPRFHHRTFLRRAARHGWTVKPRLGEPRPRVAFLADMFVNHNDPHLGECAVRVLQHHGRRVYVPPTQVASGMAPYQVGDVEHARLGLDWNISIFAELARDGYDVVTTEPSAALMFRQEAAHLVSEPDLKLLAGRTWEFSEYMAMLAGEGRLKPGLGAVPLTVAYHEPCHQRALQGPHRLEPLLGRIPRLKLLPLDLGCSGMAGTFGLRAAQFDASLTAGRHLLDRLRESDVHFGVTQCSPCRLQMEQGAGRRTLHPAHWLAISYGLVSRPERLLRPVDPDALAE